MRSRTAGLAIFATAAVATLFIAFPRAIRAGSPDGWSPRAAAGYLDGRLNWWLTWPNAARDHDTACVSCHTALPYALARPALRSALREPDVAAPERAMLPTCTSEAPRRWRCSGAWSRRWRAPGQLVSWSSR